MGEHDGVSWGADDPLDLSELSPREREVLDAAVDGLSARAVAARLSITEATVRSHLATIYAKLGVSGRVELLARLNRHPAPESAAPPSVRKPIREHVRSVVVRRRWWLVVGAALAVVAVAFLTVRPDLPPRTEISTVVRLLDESKLSTLDLRGDTLTVVETNGSRLRVEGVSGAEFDPIAREAFLAQRVQGYTASGDDNYFGQLLAALAVMVLPPIVLLLFVFLTVRLIRRPPAHASTN